MKIIVKIVTFFVKLCIKFGIIGDYMVKTISKYYEWFVYQRSIWIEPQIMLVET